ncbi:uridine kinase [Halorarius halobius]|uniref:uridine kinase n=1 Tax=Halorarius halobius TaxID=2962671 RepID=UPI0020CDF174|nr:uridine kinase [Halorarius halobius]
MPVPSLVVGIAGGTGAGKTTIAREITAGVESVTLVPLDNYYEDRSGIPMEQREEINYDHPDAFDWDLLVEQLSALAEGRTVEMPEYDFSIHNRTDETTSIDPGDVIIVEGILTLHRPEIREMLDVKLYVETDADVRIIRRIRRDVVDRGRDLEGVVSQYLSTVKPMHEQFVEPTKKEADLIIPEGVNDTAVDLLRERVRGVVSGDERPGV